MSHSADGNLFYHQRFTLEPKPQDSILLAFCWHKTGNVFTVAPPSLSFGPHGPHNPWYNLYNIKVICICETARIILPIYVSTNEELEQAAFLERLARDFSATQRVHVYYIRTPPSFFHELRMVYRGVPKKAPTLALTRLRA